MTGIQNEFVLRLTRAAATPGPVTPYKSGFAGL